MAPTARREQLVGVAARLLTEQGPAHLQIKELAEVAGVTRPVVYRFFPTRLALVEAILDDFTRELTARFHAALARSLAGSLPVIVRAFVDACCDAILVKGKGAWRLMYARGADVEAARLGQAALHRLLAPWLPRVAELTELTSARVELLAGVVVAAGGAALDGWLDGRLARKHAVDLAVRSVTALLAEFAADGRAPRRPRAGVTAPAAPRR